MVCAYEGLHAIYLIVLIYISYHSKVMTAAHRVYQNDDVFRVLARHCDKPSLVRLMIIEQKGTIFDTCVKELYREVDYDDIKSMLRDTVSLAFHRR
jgi:hypothetical protein